MTLRFCLVLLTVGQLALSSPTNLYGQPLAPLHEPSGNPAVSNSYIVVLKASTTVELFQAHLSLLQAATEFEPLDGGQNGVKFVFEHAIMGYSGYLSPNVVQLIRSRREVEYVEVDQVVEQDNNIKMDKEDVDDNASGPASNDTATEEVPRAQNDKGMTSIFLARVECLLRDVAATIYSMKAGGKTQESGRTCTVDVISKFPVWSNRSQAVVDTAGAAAAKGLVTITCAGNAGTCEYSAAKASISTASDEVTNETGHLGSGNYNLIFQNSIQNMVPL